MADQVSLELVKDECTVPPPDNLIAVNWGSVYPDVVKVASQGEFKRGTLLMGDVAGNFIASTKAGLTSANTFCILCDDVTIGENQYAETAAYFQGEFNDSKVIFPFETAEDDHDELIELARDNLRRSKIFLRHLHD
ncbi:MAG: hypothetical protein IJP48_07135 [Synergistaceae bacterium]|nr:hypothetical protein [Synergistaceae bacterium]